jgi:hypothetical protein
VWKLLTLLTALQVSATSPGQLIPHTECTTLTGTRVVFPKAGSEKPLLLVLSFSHKSAADATSWNKRFEPDYQGNLIDYYELADFQGVPSFVMRMILHGMRRSVQEPERSHLAPFFNREDYWEKLVNFNDPKIAYVVLTNGSGEVVLQTRGPASDAKAAEVERAISQLRSIKK